MTTKNGTHRRYPTTLIVTLIFSAVILIGCQSTPVQVDPGGILGGIAGSERPAWIDRYPVDSAYYIGIGSSKSGDKTTDMDRARADALVNLAASISTQIRSEQFSTSREDSEGNSFQSAEQIIRETVDQNLREIEVADSYYSESEGYWFFVRLDKEIWAAIQREEMDRLARRVISLVGPEIGDSNSSISSRLGTLWKGWQLLSESPYSDLIEAALSGREGLLIDLIEREMVRHVDSLSLHFKPDTLTARPGAAFAFEAVVKTSMEILPGTMSIIIADADDPSFLLGEVITKEEGVYSGELILRDQEPGNVRLIGRLNLEVIGLDLERIPKQFFIPETDLLLRVELLSAALAVSALSGEEAAEVQNLYGSFESLLSSKLPIEFVSEPGQEYEISVMVAFREAPPNEYDLIIAYSKAFISVSRGEGVVYSYETPEYKDGGLTSAQAQTRALKKLMEGLEELAELSTELAKAFSL
jgi:hypothetical protein